MGDINLDANEVAKGLFIRSSGQWRIAACCNYCSLVFFDGDESHLPDSGWLAEAVPHILAVHSDRFGGK